MKRTRAYQGRGKQVYEDSQGSAEMQISTQMPYDPPSYLQNNTPEAPVVNYARASVSSNKSKSVTRKDVQLVQNLIERGIQLYMERDKVVHSVSYQARVDPCVTTLVWQKLEEQNKEFFRSYYIRLELIKQIRVFNQLLEQQHHHMMNYSVSPNVPMASTQGIHHMPSHAQIDSMSSTSSYRVGNGIPASGIVHPTPKNSGMEMDRRPFIPTRSFQSEMASIGQFPCTPTDTIPSIPPIQPEMSMYPASVTSNVQFPIQPEMSMYPASVTSNGHFPPTEIPELSVNTSTLDSTFTSHLPSPEDWQHGLGWLPKSNEHLQSLSQIPGNSNERFQSLSQIPENSNELFQSLFQIPGNSNEPFQPLSQIPGNLELSVDTSALDSIFTKSPEDWQLGLDEWPASSNKHLQSLLQIPENSEWSVDTSEGWQLGLDGWPTNSNEPLESSSQILGNSELSVDLSALGSTFTSHVESPVGWQPGLDGRPVNSNETLQSLSQIPLNSSFSDLTARLADMEVEDYFVEPDPVQFSSWEEGEP